MTNATAHSELDPRAERELEPELALEREPESRRFSARTTGSPSRWGALAGKRRATGLQGNAAGGVDEGHAVLIALAPESEPELEREPELALALEPALVPELEPEPERAPERHTPSRTLRLHLLVLTLALFAPTAAQASMFGEENISLAALVAQAAEQVTELRQQLAMATQTYNETRKYVGMLEDAQTAFADMKSFGTTVFTHPEQALQSVLPESAYLQYQLSTPQNWARGTGELQNRVRMCLGGAGPCSEFYEAVRAEQAKRSISDTFGTVPKGKGGEALDVVDTEAARAIADSTANASRSAKNAGVARALREKCLMGTSSDALAACQAAANLGALTQLEETAVLNEQLAQANRLKALELAERNGQLKRELKEAKNRRQAISDGFRDMKSVRLGGDTVDNAPLESPALPHSDSP